MTDMNQYLQELLNRVNQRSDIEEKQYECSACKDTGWKQVEDEDGHIYAARCDCWELKQARALMDKSGISEEFKKKGFKNFETKENVQLINARTKSINYVKEFENYEHQRFNSILFSGQVGSGKTHLGIAICSNLMAKGVAVRYMAYRNVVTKIKQNLTDEQAYEAELHKYMTARVLFIDDLLKGRITESDVNIMYEIVNHRYMNNLPMIISTEKSLDELLNFDEAIASRIIEMCRGNIIRMNGKELNYRLYG